MKNNYSTTEEMVGKQWKIEGDIHHFKSRKTKFSGDVVLTTDKKEFLFKLPSEEKAFINACSSNLNGTVKMEVNLPVPKKEENQERGLSIPDSNSDEVMPLIKGILIDTLKNLRDINENVSDKKTKKILDTAKQISNTVNTLLQAVKTELQINQNLKKK